MMKKLLITALAGLIVLGVSATAGAVVLSPSGTVYSVPTNDSTLFPGIGAPIATITKSYSTSVLSGTITQEIYRNAAGNLVFVYDIYDTSASTNAVKRFTAIDFTGFTTNVDAYTVGGLDMAATGIDREYANVVGFDYATANKIEPGKESARMWIETNAPIYTTGYANIIDGDIARVELYAPAVPEPASMMLLGSGLLGLLGLKRKKS